MKVKNGSCIRHLSFKTLMAARKRNIIAVLAIALTALLFTSLFTIVMSINETNQNYQFRSVGGYAHGAFKDVDEDQIAVLSAHPDVKAVGEKIKVTYGNGDTAYDVNYTVCALVDVPYNMSSRFYTMGYEAILSADALYRDAGEDNVFPMVYLFDTPSPEAEAAAESYLARLTSDPDSPLMYESKATHRAYFQEFRMTFVILGGLLCAIIGIVGILNFFNAMMTAILARSREFAVLQSVGMTGRQLETMLLWEGLLYTLGSGLIAGLLSAAVNPLAGRLLESAYWFYSYHYTITPVLAMLPAFIVLGCAIPAVMYRQAVKQSIVERLRSLDT